MGQRNSRSLDEGSERERCLTGRDTRPRTSPNYYIAPLNDDSCPLLDMSPDIVERICRLLNLSDISSLSQSCSSLNNSVGEFLRHECSANALMSSYRDFLGKFENLSTLKERRVMADIKLPVSVEEEVSRMTLYRMLANRRMVEGLVSRVSLCDPEVCVPHRGTRYIHITSDEDLGRNILEVSSVCWLQISHTFKSVDPGTYSVSLLLKLETNFRMPHTGDDYTEWTVNYPGDVGGQQVNVKVFKDWWQRIRRGETPQTGSGDLVVEHDPSSDWIRVTVPGVVVRQRGEVCFDMKDVVCPWWKSGIYFDFLQLSRT